MVGRQAELDSLFAWLRTPPAVSVRLLVGAAGIGKTRLALELIETMAPKGWQTGFLTRRNLRQFRRQQSLRDWVWDTPVLGVVDYASASARHLHEWLKELADNPVWEDDDAGFNRPLRLLLLERQAERATGWWAAVIGHGRAAAAVEQLLDPAGPMILRPIDDPSDRRTIFTNTLQGLDSAVRPPTPGHDPDFDRRLTEQTWGGVPLMLMMAAVTAADSGFGSVLTIGSDKLALAVAEMEMERILKVMEGSGVRMELVPLVKHMIAITVLRQGLEPQAAFTAIEQESTALGYNVAGGAAALRDAMAAALPDTAGGIATVKPDMVGEALLLSIWPRSDDDTCHALTRALADDPIAVRETVIRTCHDYVIRGHPHALVWLQQICAEADDLIELIELSHVMPQETLELRETKVNLHMKIVDLARIRTQTVEGAPLLANSLNSMSVSLSELGRGDEALAAISEAMELFRKLAAAHPNAFRPDLAMSLNNLSSRLSEHGRHDEALAAIYEAVNIRRELAAARPDAFRFSLAKSLNSLADRLSEHGRSNEAFAAISEAVNLYRELAAAHPDAFRPNLANSLNSLSYQLSERGRYDEALAAISEAVNLYRELATARPDAFGPNLAMSLTNLSYQLSGHGRHDEALAAAKEAARLYRELAAARPDASRPDLANSLNHLSYQLSKHGRHDEALAAAKEAARLYRELAAARPDTFRPDLAMSLNHLSYQLSEQRRDDEALAAIKEAVNLYRDLATARPDTFRPYLASSLNSLSDRLSESGRDDASFAEIESAVATLRDPFLSLPASSSEQMNVVVTNYLTKCRRLDKDPDTALLTPVIKNIQRLNRQSKPITNEELVMIDVEDLAIQSAKLVGSPVLNNAGNWVVDWIRRRLKSHREVIEGVDKVAADPDSKAATKILEGHLHEALERSPRLAAELRDLLEQRGVRYAKQSARAKGGSTIKQIQGNNNRA